MAEFISSHRSWGPHVTHSPLVSARMVGHVLATARRRQPRHGFRASRDYTVPPGPPASKLTATATARPRESVRRVGGAARGTTARVLAFYYRGRSSTRRHDQGLITATPTNDVRVLPASGADPQVSAASH